MSDRSPDIQVLEGQAHLRGRGAVKGVLLDTISVIEMRMKGREVKMYNIDIDKIFDLQDAVRSHEVAKHR